MGAKGLPVVQTVVSFTCDGWRAQLSHSSRGPSHFACRLRSVVRSLAPQRRTRRITGAATFEFSSVGDAVVALCLSAHVFVSLLPVRFAQALRPAIAYA